MMAIHQPCSIGMTLSACFAEGDGPGFGHFPDFVSLFSLSPGFWEYFCLPDFISDGLRTPSMAGYVTDRGTPVRGEAVLRVVEKDLSCPCAVGRRTSFLVVFEPQQDVSLCLGLTMNWGRRTRKD
ncbi:hypothetical protein Acr_00g0011310 [Actinidia rufa]|uniref:Uncharacterized protein n=1 Tax=Actinidia rufa TaxID=165716 RepID=A0A7J0D9E6_9ERIC|nr:hypothetical protein Acr_00g0011310 [Actinidia rufa]